MTTQLSQQTLSPGTPQVRKNLFQRWMQPRAVNRDAAFRERIMRGAIAILTLLGAISFLLNVLVFKSAWSLVSFPSLHVIALTGFLLTAVLMTRGHLVAAGLLLTITVLLGASILILLARQEGAITTIIIGLPSFMFVPLVATLVLPRSYIISASILSAAMYILVQYGVQIGAFQIAGLSAEQGATPVIALLLIEGTLLLQFRVEFDARLEAMRVSIQQEEKAREQAEFDRQRAESADKAKTHFLANMSHELRTPLNAIIGYDEAMLGGMVGTFTEDQSKLLRHIQHNSRRLLGLINDVLDLSKIESGSLEVYAAPVSPQKIIEQTVESLQSLAREKNITLEMKFAEETPGVVLTDSKKLQQIVVNLVGNAIKFTENGGVTVEVKLLDKANWQFKVSDTGIGIPADAVKTIFEPFHQVDNSATRKYKGTGLGLSISKRLIELMHGKIEVTSELGKGSSFTVTMPRASIPGDAESASTPELSLPKS